MFLSTHKNVLLGTSLQSLDGSGVATGGGGKGAEPPLGSFWAPMRSVQIRGEIYKGRVGHIHRKRCAHFSQVKITDRNDPAETWKFDVRGRWKGYHAKFSSTKGRMLLGQAQNLQ